MLNENICLGGAEGASVLRRVSSWSGRPPKIVLAGFGFSLGQLASGHWGAILSPRALKTCRDTTEPAPKGPEKFRLPSPKFELHGQQQG